MKKKTHSDKKLTRIVAHEAESLAGDLLLEVFFGEVGPAAKVRLDAEVRELLPVTDAGPVYIIIIKIMIIFFLACNGCRTCIYNNNMFVCV